MAWPTRRSAPRPVNLNGQPGARGRGRGVIQIEGLIDLQKALREIDQDLPKQLRAANKKAAEVVASAARRRAFMLGGVQAKVAPSIRAAAEQRAAKVAWGGARYPFAAGANFGAYHWVLRSRFTGKALGFGRTMAFKQIDTGLRLANNAKPFGTILGWNQFPEWGGNQFTGGARDMFIYRTLREHGVVNDFVDAYDEAIGDLMRRAFPD